MANLDLFNDDDEHRTARRLMDDIDDRIAAEFTDERDDLLRPFRKRRLSDDDEPVDCA